MRYDSFARAMCAPAEIGLKARHLREIQEEEMGCPAPISPAGLGVSIYGGSVPITRNRRYVA